MNRGIIHHGFCGADVSDAGSSASAEGELGISYAASDADLREGVERIAEACRRLA